MWKQRKTCLVCGEQLYNTDTGEQRWLTCSHDCYVTYKRWKKQGKLPGHKVKLTIHQKGEITKRIKSEVKGGQYQTTRLAEWAMKALGIGDVTPVKQKPPTQGELNRKAEWKAFLEECDKEEAEEAKHKFPRRA